MIAMLASGCGSQVTAVPSASIIPSPSPLPSPYDSDVAVTFQLTINGTVVDGDSFVVTFEPPPTSREPVIFRFCPHDSAPCAGSGMTYELGGGFQPKGQTLPYTFVRVTGSGAKHVIAQGMAPLKASETILVTYSY